MNYIVAVVLLLFLFRPVSSVEVCGGLLLFVLDVVVVSVIGSVGLSLGLLFVGYRISLSQFLCWNLA